jgi:peptidyl-prolyl cis-trans isomerase D
MISWIQKYFQQHFKAIFAVLLAVTIISFIFTIGAAPGIGNAQRQTVERRVFGYNLGSPEDQQKLFGDAAVSAQLQIGYMGDEAELQNYGFQRAAFLSLADQLHIPPPSKQEIADFIKTLRTFAGEDGQFSAQRYAQFRESLKNNPSRGEASISRILADDVRINKVQSLLGGPGYVMPSDVKAQLEQADTSWTLGLATVDYASFKPDIPVNDAILKKFYDENTFRYEIPPRIVVSAAEFTATAFLPSINVSDADVRAFYDANPARFPKPAADPKAPAKIDPAADFAAVRPQVEAALKLDRARREAAKAAADFSFALYERKLKPGTPEFVSFLGSKNITLKPLAPFTREAGPAEFNGSREVAAEAFKLNQERVVSDAVNTPAGAVVLFWNDLQPARQPALAEVREKVSADYVEGEKRKRFVELGRTIRSTIETRLKAGDTFEKAVAAAASAGSVKIDAKLLPAFTRRQPPQDLDYTVYTVLDRLEKGSVSDMTVARDHGLIVYAADKKLPDLSETSPQYAAIHDQIATGSARIAASSYVRDLVDDELKRSAPEAQ